MDRMGSRRKEKRKGKNGRRAGGYPQQLTRKEESWKGEMREGREKVSERQASEDSGSGTSHRHLLLLLFTARWAVLGDGSGTATALSLFTLLGILFSKTCPSDQVPSHSRSFLFLPVLLHSLAAFQNGLVRDFFLLLSLSADGGKILFWIPFFNPH